MNMEIDKWIHIKMTWATASLGHNFRWLGEFLDDLEIELGDDIDRLSSRWAEMLTDIETVRFGLINRHVPKDEAVDDSSDGTGS
jgi:hypothetical protein